MWISRREKELLEKTIEILEGELKGLREENRFLLDKFFGGSLVQSEALSSAVREIDMGPEVEELMAGTVLSKEDSENGSNRQED